MDAKLIFEHRRVFAIDDERKNGALYAYVKAILVDDDYLVVDKTYSLDDWLREPEPGWQKPIAGVTAERVGSNYKTCARAVEIAGDWFNACSYYAENSVTLLFLEQAEKDTQAAE